ncbi:hypothetical protein OC844_006684 [Tilletia horrida]|nr:hypothetical protein OC844_006684 [Tilletia horrida]
MKIDAADDDQDGDRDGDWADEDEEWEQEEDVGAGASASRRGSKKATPEGGDANGQLAALLQEADALRPSAGAYLATALKHMRPVVAYEPQQKAVRRVKDVWCKDVLTFFCTLARHEVASRTRYPPGTFAHVLLMGILDRLENAAIEIENLSSLSPLAQTREARIIASTWSQDIALFRHPTRLCLQELGIHESKQRRLAAGVQDSSVSLLNSDNIIYAFRDKVEMSWHSIEWESSEAPDLNKLLILSELLKGVQCGDKARPVSVEISQLNFDDEEQAGDWRFDAEEEGALLTQRMFEQASFLTSAEAPSTLLGYIAILFRVGNEEHTPLFLLLLAALARERIKARADDAHASLLLSKSLSILALVQESDHVFSARDIAAEAVAALRHLHASSPCRYDRDLAAGLVSLSEVAAEPLYTQELLEAGKEAAGIYARLLQEQPNDISLKVGLARALKAQGDLLDDLEEDDDACDRYQRTVDLYRDLAQQMPSLFTIGLASRIGLLSKMLNPDTHADQAMQLSTEAIELIESQTDAWPSLTKYHLITLYMGRAVTQSDRSELDAAELSITSAYDACRAYAEEFGDPQEEMLAVIHLVRASIRIAAERYMDALPDSKAAVKLYRDLGPEGVDRWAQLISSVLTIQGFCHWMGDNCKSAMTALREGARILQEEQISDSTATQSDELAGCLQNLGAVQCRLGNATLALETGQRAVEAARGAIGNDAAAGKATSHTLAQALVFLAATLLDLGRAEEALACTTEATDLMEKHGTADSRRKTGLLVHAKVLDSLQRQKEAELARAEAEKLPGLGYAHKLGAKDSQA